MASNPYVNKVQKADGTVLIDISEDTVTAARLLNGYTAHDKSGAQITGNIATKTASDMIVSGGTVTAPAGYYASAQSKSVANGTITNNTSGGASSGTINRGSQIKIGAGYYSSDNYYTAQANSGTKAISQAGTTSVDGYAYVDVAENCLIVTVTATSGTTKTISNALITSDYYVFNTAFSGAAADVSWTTGSGTLTLSCSEGIPAMTLFLCRQM